MYLPGIAVLVGTGICKKKKYYCCENILFLCKFILEIRVSFKLGLDVYIFVKGQVTVKVGEYLCVCVKKKKKNRRKKERSSRSLTLL